VELVLFCNDEVWDFEEICLVELSDTFSSVGAIQIATTVPATMHKNVKN
jgi:hypothetical protein